MQKYAMLRQRVVDKGIIAPEWLIVPHAATDEKLCRAHEPEYVRRAQAGELTAQEICRIGFPWSLQTSELIELSVFSRHKANEIFPDQALLDIAIFNAEIIREAAEMTKGL